MTARNEALQVFLRVRPPIFKEVKEQNAVHVRNSQTVTLIDDRKETTCSYDSVFNEVSEQEEVFEKVKPLLEDVLSGVNACIFAYGQTSAGKSYTMIGPNGGQDIFRRDADDWGILPRASEFLLGYLNEKAMEGVLSYEVKASFLQIYNENLYDLLRDTGPMIEDKLALNDKEKDTELKIREIPRRKTKDNPSSGAEVFVSGLSEFRVQTSEDILKILAVGTNNRMTRSTDFNATSSRSHALLQLTFEIEAQTEAGQTVINKSKLNLVDLAGSEKIPFVASEYNNAKHMKELTSINKSLSSLGNVIAALSSNNRTHIPYRDSKLTRILQDSLSGNTRTILLACVAPTILHASETLSTLQFADRAKNVMLSVKPNTLVDDKQLLTKAHGEITRLKTLLAHALKQLEARGKENGGDPAELMRLQEENEALRRDNAALRKSVSHQPAGSSQPQQGALPYLNYSASNPSFPAGNPSAGLFQQGQMSLDSQLQLGSHGKQQHGSRFSLDVERERKAPKKGSKAQRHMPPLFDLLETGKKKAAGRRGHGDVVPAAAKIHSKAYKSINDRQIEELNSMLSVSNMQQHQQQQNMMQYLQQQQFVQQNFPHQQLGSLPLLGPQHAGAASSIPGLSPAMASVNAMAASLMPPHAYNTSSNTGGYHTGNGAAHPNGQLLNPYHMPPILHNNNNQPPPVDPNRPAPVHLGPPFQTHHNHAHTEQPWQPPTDAQTPAVLPSIVPSAVQPAFQQQQQQQETPHQQPQPHQQSAAVPTDVSPVTVEPSPQPKSRHRHRHHHRKSSDKDPQSGVPRTRSEDPADDQASSRDEQGALPVTDRSALGSSSGVVDPGRIGTGHSTPGGNGTVWMPANRIVRKGTQGALKLAPAGGDSSDSDAENDHHHARATRRGEGDYSSTASMKGKPGSSSSTSSGLGGFGSSGNVLAGTGQHAFLANIMHKQAQIGTPSGLGQTAGGVSAAESLPIARQANLSHSSEDVGRSVQLFSFRMNTWDRIQIVDFDSVKRQHKCRHSDGAEQWLDLSKKPIRAIPDM